MPNALAREKSPYLRQHQFNPVQWLPWGDEAFARAQQEGKPVLLSIGYAACHWCHVMARESFEDAQTAELMNEHFVCIKVDREERPDVDAIYLRALETIGKRAGWPLTMFLTPTRKPFWGGTYFPPEQRGQQPGFREVLVRVSETYLADPRTAEQKAGEVIDALVGSTLEPPGCRELPPQRVLEAAEDLLRKFDPENGGLKGAPKFPFPALLRFVWNVGCRTGRKDLQEAAKLTLSRMIRGGIFDHVGGGFARYAIDATWMVPHFEKMLYDNALLVQVLAEVWRGNRDEMYRDAVQRTVAWLLREMTIAGGAFACSLDAESAGEEGGFYVWSEREIDGLLGADAALFKQAYGVTSEGNFEQRNVLNRLAATPDMTDADEPRLARCRAVLFQARTKRPRPRRDEKVLADWNGLTISALAKAAATFDQPVWLEGAETAFEFVNGNMVRHGALYHSWCDGELGEASILDDYANMACAALSLYEVTGHARYLERAKEWVDRCTLHFAEANSGVFYFTSDESDSLVARICDGNDAATPSGNGVMAHVLARLYYLTGDDHYRERARSTIFAFTGRVTEDSFRLATLLDASQFLAVAVQVTIIGNAGDDTTRKLVAAAHQHGGPDNVVVLAQPGMALSSQHPAVRKLATSRRPAAFVCAGTTCSAPVFDSPGLRHALDAMTLEGSPYNI
jgi:uncharacterized protein YyaL (SSP411 family)